MVTPAPSLAALAANRGGQQVARRQTMDRCAVCDLWAGERMALRQALIEARAFAEWPAGAAELARVIRVIDAALALSQTP